MTDSTRTRTISWQDPMIGAAAARTMRGIDYLRAMVKGDIPPPPISMLFDMTMAEVEAGRVVFGATPNESFYNPIGVIHGGFACTLLDSVMGCAAQSMMPEGMAYTTLDLTVNLVRPITLNTGAMRAIGETIHVGRRVITAQGRLVDANDKLYAHATTTCMVFPIEGG